MYPSRFNFFQEDGEENVQIDQTDDSSNNEVVDTAEEEPVQEAMFDAGFNNLRMKVYQAIGDRFNVTNVFKGMNGKDKFDITSDDMPNVRTTVESTGTGCNVVTWGVNKIKTHYRGISLSMAANNIISLFDNPELLLEEAVPNFSRFGNVFMESNDEEEDKEDDDNEDLDKTLKDMILPTYKMNMIQKKLNY